MCQDIEFPWLYSLGGLADIKHVQTMYKCVEALNVHGGIVLAGLQRHKACTKYVHVC